MLKLFKPLKPRPGCQIAAIPVMRQPLGSLLIKLLFNPQHFTISVNPSFQRIPVFQDRLMRDFNGGFTCLAIAIQYQHTFADKQIEHRLQMLLIELCGFQRGQCHTPPRIFLTFTHPDKAQK